MRMKLGIRALPWGLSRKRTVMSGSKGAKALAPHPLSSAVIELEWQVERSSERTAAGISLFQVPGRILDVRLSPKPTNTGMSTTTPSTQPAMNRTSAGRPEGATSPATARLCNRCTTGLRVSATVELRTSHYRTEVRHRLSIADSLFFPVASRGVPAGLRFRRRWKSPPQRRLPILFRGH